MRRTAALIVGGGPAGAAAAITLARGGVRATLLERTREPTDPLCGGFLSWRTLDALTALGIERDELNPHCIETLRVFAKGRVASSVLPRPALAVSRRRLDQLLLKRAIATGAGVERGVAVRAIESRAARLADGTNLTAGAILLATGKHDLHGLPRAGPEADPALGLRTRLPPSPALDRLVGGAIELHLFDRGYAGLALQEDGSANLCLAVRRSRLKDAGDPSALLSALARETPHLGERLAQLSTVPAVDAVANVPYGWIARATSPGLFRIGDQAAVIPSLAGEGVGIALASGGAAAAAILSGSTAESYQRGFARRAARPVHIASLIRACAEQPQGARLLVALSKVPLAPRAAARLTRIRQSQVDARAAGPHS